MNKFLTGHPYLFIAAALSVVNVILVWSFRFLPLYDYPIWLFETKILREFLRPESPYHTYFEFIPVPAPNLAFTAVTWMLSWIVSIEAAGKLFLTLCVVGFPWSLWYSIRALSPNPDPVQAYIGFPYSFNLFMFGGHGYLLGLIFFLYTIGYFVPKFERLSPGQWRLLSFALLILYLLHAIPFALAGVAFITLAFSSRVQRWKNLSRICLGFLVPLVAFVWYLLETPFVAGSPSSLGLGTAARSLLKPVFLFIKTYGIDSPFSPTVLNASWVLILLILGWQLLKKSRSGNLWDRRFIFPALFSALLMLLLPEDFFGMWQAGARFALPLMFFFLCLTLPAVVSSKWKTIFFVAASIVTVYNAVHFRNVDRQLNEYYNDLTSEVDLEEPFYDIKFDWPAGTSFWDQGSASVNPLFGAPYYAYLQVEGVGWIHETGVLKLRDPFRSYAPDVKGRTVSEFESSILNHIESFKFFKSVAVVGKGEEAKTVIRSLENLGFRPKLVRDLWTILEDRQ